MAPSLIIHQYLANSHLLKYNINEIKETEIKDIQESDAILQEKKRNTIWEPKFKHYSSRLTRK